MSSTDSLLHQRIIHHYQENSDIDKYTVIKKRDLLEFDPIPYIASLKLTELPREEGMIDDLAEHIGRDLAVQEVSHFSKSIVKITDNTTETKMGNLSQTLDDVYNHLWDEGYESDLYFIPFSLNQEIRRQKNLTFANITGFLARPIHMKELGKNQIILANKNNFEKIYPKTSERVEISINRLYHHSNHAEINCQINQKLEVKNKHSIARILITDN